MNQKWQVCIVVNHRNHRQAPLSTRSGRLNLAKGNQTVGGPHEGVIGCKMDAMRPIRTRTRLMSRKITALIATSLLLAAVPLPGRTQGFDSTTHKLCSEARDYMGCVKANTKSTSGDGQKAKTAESQLVATPNSCPTGYAYSGAGNCKNVLCTWEAGDDQGLAGKAWKCSGGVQKQFLRWGNNVVKANVDSKCPPRQPRVGWQSTCEER